MKLLIVKLSAFGDIIHALPALDDLLARPEVKEVHWLLDARYAFVSDIFPPQVHVHQVDLRGSQPLRSAWRTIRRLRRECFDVVLDVQGLLKSALLARLIHPRVYGLDVRHLREKASRFLTTPVHGHAEERHVVQQYRRVASAPFGDAPEAIAYAPPHILPEQVNTHAGNALLQRWNVQPRHYAWLHLGGGWETKRLPRRTWIRLANLLADQKLTPILGWGDCNEEELAKTIRNNVSGAVLPEKRLEMSELCAILGQSRVVVGPDTGVVHLAAALGAPTVSFWGPSASWRSAPHGEHHRHIESSPACGPCFKRTCNAFICMDMIDADDILSAIDDVCSAR